MHSKLEDVLLLFDDGQYFEAQEVFLTAPADMDEQEKKIFKSLGHINRGFCHYENEENEQAITMILDGYSKLKDLEKKESGFSINRLMHDLEKVLHDLQNGLKVHVKPKVHFN